MQNNGGIELPGYEAARVLGKRGSILPDRGGSGRRNGKGGRNSRRRRTLVLAFMAACILGLAGAGAFFYGQSGQEEKSEFDGTFVKADPEDFEGAAEDMPATSALEGWA